MTRRRFLVGSSLFGLSTWAVLVDGLGRRVAVAQPPMTQEAYSEMERKILSPHQWRTVEAVTGRLLPAKDGAPGGVEAGCVQFIDRVLERADDSMKDLYSRGVSALDAVCRQRFGGIFRQLEPSAQDQALLALEEGTMLEEWPEGAVDPREFFETVRQHTMLGFLAPPEYGGNRDYAGWRVTGYPGPGHGNDGYSVEQMTGQASIVTVWGATWHPPGSAGAGTEPERGSQKGNGGEEKETGSGEDDSSS